MVPQREQPVRAVKLARLAVHLGRPTAGAASPGTRVLPPVVLWQAAQTAAPELVPDAWLAGAAT